MCLTQDIVITLHKGGRKSKTDPNNYRAITVSSAILKLFKRLLLESMKASISKPLNGLQGGLKRKRRLFALLLLSYICIITINVMWLFLTVPWVGLQFVAVVFPDHTHLLSGQI